MCDLVRSHDCSVGQRQTELYVWKGTNWIRIIYSDVLTVEVAGKKALNPAVFSTARSVDHSHFQPSPLNLKRKE